MAADFGSIYYEIYPVTATFSATFVDSDGIEQFSFTESDCTNVNNEYLSYTSLELDNVNGITSVISQGKTYTYESYDGGRRITVNLPSSTTCTRDSTQDVIGHASQIDANTLYNITDDTDVTLTILEALYPVGSVYITTANTCPLSALISGSTWALVSSGRVLQGADSGHSAGTTIEAGLPNITGLRKADTVQGEVSGAYSKSSAVSSYGTSSGGLGYFNVEFDASRSSSIYGNSTTVQPPAYVVNIYRRTA